MVGSRCRFKDYCVLVQGLALDNVVLARRLAIDVSSRFRSDNVVLRQRLAIDASSRFSSR